MHIITYVNRKSKCFLKNLFVEFNSVLIHTSFRFSLRYIMPELDDKRIYDNKYKEWRRSILSRDGRKCIKCGGVKKLHAHHKKPWAEYPELRYEVSNGETVCLDCHLIIHPFMVKYLKKKKNKHEKFLDKKQRKENSKKFRKFIQHNGFKGVTSKRLSSRYSEHQFSKDNPNPNWG